MDTSIPAHKTAVVVISTSSIDYLPITKPQNMFVLRPHILMGTKKATDGTTIKAQEFYRWMVDNRNVLPRTLVNDFNEITKLLLDIRERGYEKVLVVSLCRTLSDTYYAVKEVQSIIQNRIEVDLYDTQTFSIGESLFGIRACEMLEEGKTIAQIIAHLDMIKRNVSVYFMLDSLYYLSKNGRLSRVSNFVSSIFQLKPVFRHKGGDLTVISKVRKTSNALREFGEFITNELSNKNAWGMGIYCGSHQLYDDFMNNVKGDVKGTVPLSPVVGSHFGPASVGLAVYYNTDEYLPENYQFIK